MSERWTSEQDNDLLDMDARGVSPARMGIRIGRETAAVVRRLKTLKERVERQSKGYERSPLSASHRNSIKIGLALARQRRAGAAE